MLWKVAVCRPGEPRTWHECPGSAHWESLLAAAQAMPAGEVCAVSQDHSEGMHMVFETDGGLLVHHGPAGLRRVVFPHRPTPPSGVCDWVGLPPQDFLPTHGFLRAEAFGLLRLFLSTGELPALAPRPRAEHPRLPGMEQPVRADEWWQVRWVPAGEW